MLLPEPPFVGIALGTARGGVALASSPGVKALRLGWAGGLRRGGEREAPLLESRRLCCESMTCAATEDRPFEPNWRVWESPEGAGLNTGGRVEGEGRGGGSLEVLGWGAGAEGGGGAVEVGWEGGDRPRASESLGVNSSTCETGGSAAAIGGEKEGAEVAGDALDAPATRGTAAAVDPAARAHPFGSATATVGGDEGGGRAPASTEFLRLRPIPLWRCPGNCGCCSRPGDVGGWFGSCPPCASRRAAWAARLFLRS